jgi:hypothetical protein
MSRVLDTDELIDTIRRRAMIPDDSSVFTNEDLLEIMNEEIDVGLLSTLMSLNEEHLVTQEDIDTAKDKTSYTIPYRAVGNKLRDVAYVDSAGGIYEMSRISLEELSDYRYFKSASREHVFYVQNNQIKLVDTTVTDFEKLRMYFYMRPNKLVDTNRVGVITSINRTTGVVAVSSFPDNFSSLPKMDFVQAETPNKILSYDITPSAVNQNTRTITFTASDIPEDLVVGDYLCRAQETPVPNLPTEFHPILAQRVAVHVLESLGDTEGMGNAPQKINPRHSTLKNSISRFSRYRNKIR